MWFPHFRHAQNVMNMNRYMNAELADIHFIYGLANGKGRVVVRLYGERYSKRWQPNHQTFARVHHKLEHESFRATIDDTPVNSEIDLVARISNAADTISATPGISEHVRQSMSRWCRACIHANGSCFKHLL
ncbi:hypothetical protein TNCV_4358951 [Trichonephila clavipes]|nr:hypothetical protein TNCV_36221 [Trichonephila clavipes]GFW39900.1 hypothetical protein TNCV_4358951 [Trichonephila clavipes]